MAAAVVVRLVSADEAGAPAAAFAPAVVEGAAPCATSASKHQLPIQQRRACSERHPERETVGILIIVYHRTC